MKEHPVLPDLSPAKALHVLFVVLCDIAAILGGVFIVAGLLALVLERELLAGVCVVGLLLSAAVLVRLIVAQKQLEDHRV